MPKDFKNNPPPRDEGRTAHPLLLGMIIGLLLGIVIALAVALWLNRLSNPFVDKAKPIEPLAKIGPTQPPQARGEGRRREGRAAARPPREKAEDGAAALRVLHDASRREGSDGQGGQGRRRQAEGARQGRPRLRRPRQPKPPFGRDLLAAGRRLLRGEGRRQPQGQDRLHRPGGHGEARRGARARARCTASGWAPTRASRTRTESRPRCPRTGSARPSSAPTKPRTTDGVQTMSLRRILTLALATLGLAAGSAHAQLRPGQDFTLLQPPQSTDGGGKVEVIEFFSYACGHCYKLEPFLESWAKKLPAGRRLQARPRRGQRRVDAARAPLLLARGDGQARRAARARPSTRCTRRT